MMSRSKHGDVVSDALSRAVAVDAHLLVVQTVVVGLHRLALSQRQPEAGPVLEQEKSVKFVLFRKVYSKKYEDTIAYSL